MRAELFKFTLGATEYNYTNVSQNVSYNGDTYIPVVIGHGKRESRTDAAKTSLTVKLSVDNPLSVELLRSTDNTLSLTMFVHTDSYTDIVWKGKLSALQPRGSEVELSIESLFSSLKRPGLRAKYQRNCRHVLYADGCNVNRNSFKTTGTITEIDSNVVKSAEASSQESGYFVGGMIKDTVTGVFRFIINHEDDTLTLTREFESLIVGSNIELYPGCPHTREACLSTFNNVENYGGFPWIPTKNPFGGSSIV